jgi:hypothetical protein
MFHNDITPADRAWKCNIKRGPVDGILTVLKLGNDDFFLEAGFALMIDAST